VPQGTAATISDAVPRIEPKSRYGNPPFYDVFGRRYYVLASGAGFVERGVASWYGPGFHKIRTSSGEPYDMYAMTAAHRTLPLPAYVRVTNLENGRSVVVRVNDRGPFVGNRIIDLSYTAASRLDMLQYGTAMVELRTIDPLPPQGAAAGAATARTQGTSAEDTPGVPQRAAADTALDLSQPAPTATALDVPQRAAMAATLDQPQPAAATVPQRAILFVQAGAFADPANAARLATKLQSGGYGSIFVRNDVVAGRRMYRVRIGPVPDVPEFDRIVTALDQAGVHDARLALD
jgi:rare lipoprotein A